MSVGLKAYTRLKRVEEQALKLGFKFSSPQYGMREGDGIALVPADDALPIYSRDAEVWYGDVESVESFLRGMEWAKGYYRMLGALSDKTIARKEQDYRNRKLLELIKNSKNET